MLRFLTSGESHGQALIALLDGFPAGMEVDIELLNKELEIRQQGFGRGGRQKIEADRSEVLSGIRHGITTGAPICLLVRNRDFENWHHVMSTLAVDEHDEDVAAQEGKHKVSGFRPGHADLSGTMKYRQRDIRDVIERASARETATRVAAGALCQQFLARLGLRLAFHVVAIGTVASRLDSESLSLYELEERVNNSELFCADPALAEAMKEHIKQTGKDGDTVGGVVEVVAEGVPVGLGSYTQWDERLDGQLAQALMSIQAIKAVEIGDGIRSAAAPGSQVHDPLYEPTDSDQALPFTRKTNRAGGIEGGMSNGSRIRLRAFMKPIPTLLKGLPSLSFPEYQAQTAQYVRSDICAVPAAAVVAKAMVAIVLTRSMLQKFGADNFVEICDNLARHRQWCKQQGVNSEQSCRHEPASPQKERE
jgi:chorismate synthase